MRTTILSAAILTAASALVQTDAAWAQNARTFVSAGPNGNDANANCTNAAPCRTFASAITKTNAGGIINCLDAGGYGTLTITKSITIDCEGTFGGILAEGVTPGVLINTAGIIVVLRNLSIEGAGTGTVGVQFQNGATLHIEKCHIHGFSAGSGSPAGIKFIPSANDFFELFVSDSTISDNKGGANGILLRPTGTAFAQVTLTRIQADNNVNGITADGGGSTAGIRVSIQQSRFAGNTIHGVQSASPANGALVRVNIIGSAFVSNGGVGVLSDGAASVVLVGSSQIFGNGAGVQTSGGGVLRSYKDNQIKHNNMLNGTPVDAEVLN